jgi:hypothetical protein
VLPIGFYFASRWGIGGVALAWLIFYPLLAAPLFVITFRMIELPVRKYADSLWPATSSCVVMAAAVTLVGTAFPEGPTYMELISKIVVGGIAYTGTLLMLHRRRILVLRDLLRLLRMGTPPEAAGQRATASAEPAIPPANTEAALQPMGAV